MRSCPSGSRPGEGELWAILVARGMFIPKSSRSISKLNVWSFAVMAIWGTRTSHPCFQHPPPQCEARPRVQIPGTGPALVAGAPVPQWEPRLQYQHGPFILPIKGIVTPKQIPGWGFYSGMTLRHSEALNPHPQPPGTQNSNAEGGWLGRERGEPPCPSRWEIALPHRILWLPLEFSREEIPQAAPAGATQPAPLSCVPRDASPARCFIRYTPTHTTATSKLMVVRVCG